MKTALLFNPEIKNYGFGPGHPFSSRRFDLFFELYKKTLGENKDYELITHNEFASDEELEYFHTKDYIQVLEAASEGLIGRYFHKFISVDNVSPEGNFPINIEKAARAAVKNSILAVDYIMQEKCERAIGIGGGLHHAKPEYGEGFCVYNDVVIAVERALREYKLERILVLDTDAHAGNGVCEAFYYDSRVLFIDLHQKDIYPETGNANDIGGGIGRGFTVNFPLVAGTSDRSYELIFDKIFFPLAREFKPQLIIRYGGADPHLEDDLTNLV